MKVLRNAFDLRRTQLTGQAATKLDVDAIDEAEALVNEVTIGMIYKLNDTIFRPLFIELTDWAVKGGGNSDKAGRLARMTAFFKFLETFFGTLKVGISNLCYLKRGRANHGFLVDRHGILDICA